MVLALLALVGVTVGVAQNVKQTCAAQEAQKSTCQVPTLLHL